MSFQRVTMQTVTADFAGQRIDNYLMRELKRVPKTRIYRLLRKGEVRVNKKRCKPNYRLQENDVVRIPPVFMDEPDAKAPSPQHLIDQVRASVLYEDERLIIFNKASGIAVHGGSGVQHGFIEIVRQAFDHAQKWELVHRIDRDTSGCLMVSKKRACLRYLHRQLQEKHIKKTYLCLVNGQWHRQITVKAPLLRYHLSSGERMVKVDDEGKRSITHFKPLKVYQHATLLEAKPVTGRTHQIRVHAQNQGCTLAGDTKYASDKDNAAWQKQGLKRLFLHAQRLDLVLENGKALTVEAPLPEHLSGLLDRLDSKN